MLVYCKPTTYMYNNGPALFQHQRLRDMLLNMKFCKDLSVQYLVYQKQQHLDYNIYTCNYRRNRPMMYISITNSSLYRVYFTEMLLICFVSFPLSLSADNAEYWDETNAAMHSSQFDYVSLNGTYWRH